ncbi:MAG: family 43 glycosylhydrolase [Bacteroidaceae bacterium]|nr:family 43 glycosylhydrolase [Bacteroidaceae bacterium]
MKKVKFANSKGAPLFNGGSIWLVVFILFLVPVLPLWAEGGKSQIELADPYILLDGGKYYAYGTRDDNGIRCYSSDDLRSWKYEGLALNKINTTENIFFWAPEVYLLGDKYYMYYSANEHLYVATSNSPKGPFKQVGGYQMKNLLGDEKCIDSHVFFDDDGTAWLFFVRFNDNICIWQCRLSEDYITPVEGTLRKCIAGSQSWEQQEGRVNEGPNVIKHNRNYYLTYSGNGYQSQNYAVGYATTRDISKGNWTKYSANPILCRRDELVGTGHHSLFVDKEGILRIVFHAHNSTESVHHRLMYIGTMQFSGTHLVMTNDPIIRPTLTTNPYNPELIDKTLGFERGTSTTVDLNNDGFQDIVAGGLGNTDNNNATDENTRKRVTYVSMFNSGSHRWTSPTSAPTFQVADTPSLIPCDLNNDGFMDIVAFEQTGTDTSEEAYTNDYGREGIFLGRGNGTFREGTLIFQNPDGSNCPFDIKGPCGADVTDIDNDGRLDIICAGHQGETIYNVILHNAGIDKTVIRFIVEPYETDYHLNHAVIQAADLNNDGYQDFVISAQVDDLEDQTRFTDIYLNDSLHHGHFIRQGLGERGATIKRKANGALQVADFNNDGWMDIFLTGEGEASSGETTARQRIYANKRTATPSFSAINGTIVSDFFSLKTNVQSSVGTIDWDGDGSYDILMGGILSNTKTCTGKLYLNSLTSMAGRTFQTYTIPGAVSPSIIFPDWDGDGRKDFFLNGLSSDNNYLTDTQKGRVSILCYNLNPTPMRPDAPVNPTAIVQDSLVILSWEVPETVLPNYTYELFISDSLGNQLNSTPAFVGGTNDGVRKVNRKGRVGCMKQWTFHPSSPGTYSWGVQTVDAAYNGSTFTAGPAFTINTPTSIHSPVQREASCATEIYSLKGILHAVPQHGINILRTAEGIRKVMHP